MNNRRITVLVISLIVVVSGVFLLVRANNKQEVKTSNATQIVQAQSQEVSQPEELNKNDVSLSKAEVEKHNSASDCWTIIDGSVYDITSYVPRHPGGDEILRACGADGSTLFNQRQTTSGESVGSGSPHSSSAESQLEKLKIGKLAE